MFDVEILANARGTQHEWDSRSPYGTSCTLPRQMNSRHSNKLGHMYLTCEEAQTTCHLTSRCFIRADSRPTCEAKDMGPALDEAIPVPEKSRHRSSLEARDILIEIVGTGAVVPGCVACLVTDTRRMCRIPCAYSFTRVGRPSSVSPQALSG